MSKFCHFEQWKLKGDYQDGMVTACGPFICREIINSRDKTPQVNHFFTQGKAGPDSVNIFPEA